MNKYIHSIEFNSDFFPNPLDTWDTVKQIIEPFKQGVRNIGYVDNKVVFTCKPNSKSKITTENYSKGIIINYVSK